MEVLYVLESKSYPACHCYFIKLLMRNEFIGFRNYKNHVPLRFRVRCVSALTCSCMQPHEGCLGRRESVFTLFRVLPKFHECFYNIWEQRGNVSYYFCKITRRKIKRRNSLLYQSVNSPYRSRWRMRWRIMHCVNLSVLSIQL